MSKAKGNNSSKNVADSVGEYPRTTSCRYTVDSHLTGRNMDPY